MIKINRARRAHTGVDREDDDLAKDSALDQASVLTSDLCKCICSNPTRMVMEFDQDQLHSESARPRPSPRHAQNFSPYGKCWAITIVLIHPNWKLCHAATKRLFHTPWSLIESFTQTSNTLRYYVRVTVMHASHCSPTQVLWLIPLQFQKSMIMK